MKKIAWVISISFWTVFHLSGQSCLSDGIIFSTQEEVDSFLIEYPNCTSIEGSVSIFNTPNSPITDLNALSQITSIGGDFFVYGHVGINDFKGLENLETIGGYFAIMKNSSINDLTGLDNLTTIGGSFKISDNTAMVDISGLSSLATIGGPISIKKNLNLTDISGLNHLAVVNGSITIFENPDLLAVTGFNQVDRVKGPVQVCFNPLLVTLSGFNSLTVIEGYLWLSDDPSLTTLSGFSALDTIMQYLTIESTDDLLDISGFNSLTTIGGWLLIRNNQSLQTLSGLDNLTSVQESVSFQYNPELTDITVLQGVQRINDNLDIVENLSLEDLTGLENLTYVAKLRLQNNPLIPDLSSFSSLDTVNSLTLRDQPLIKNFMGLSTLDDLDVLVVEGNIGIFGGAGSGLENFTGLEQVTDLNNFVLKNNYQLESFNGLNNLETVERVLYFEYNDFEDLTGLESLSSLACLILIGNQNLMSLNGLNSLTGLMEYLILESNDNLQDLSALSNVSHIDDWIKIKNNDALVNLEGLNNVVAVGNGVLIHENLVLENISALAQANFATSVDTLRVTGNPNLSICSQQSICEYVLTGGAALIEDNAPGCNNMNEVIQNCFDNTAHTNFVGTLFGDLDQNCLETAEDITLPQLLIHLENEEYSYSVTTEEDGSYLLPAFAGEYELNVISPSPFWTSCFSDSTVTATGLFDTLTTDLFLVSEGACSFIEWEVSLPPLRICQSRTIVIDYCNIGALPAEDAIFSIALEEQITIDSASVPYTVDGDGILHFEIDDLDLFECDQFSLSVFLDCDTVAINQLLCIDVELQSEELCSPDSLWDGSIVTATGFCENDSVYFELTNIGSGNMSQPAQFRVDILIDDIVLLFDVNDYELNSGQAQTLSYGIAGTGFRIEADQTPGHPISNQVSAVVPNCENIANNVIFSLFPINGGDPFSGTFCTTAANSFDPNIKTVRPIGIGENHEIDKDWNLDYTIQFQNTGNDVAYLVVIKDTLSENLDLTTLRVKGASHDFTWSLNPNRELVFTFDDILLPDSTTNEPESHGFVQLSIQPKADILPGERIENKAGIYFDFNDPIITNTVFHTIRKPVVANGEDQTICAGTSFLGQLITQDTAIQELTEFVTYDSIHLYQLTVLPLASNNVISSAEIGEIFEGVLIEGDTSFVVVYNGINGCDSLVTYDITGLVNVDETVFAQIKVYPNPVKDFLQVSNQQSDFKQEWRLMNLLGKVVWEKPLDAFELLNGFFVNDFAAGVYWLEVKSDRGNGIWRIVIEQ